MNRKTFLMVIITFISLILVGCSSNELESNNLGEESIKGNCTIVDCMKLLDTNMSVEEINEIIGFEGEVNESSNKVTWRFNTSNYIILNTNPSNIIQATIDKSTLKSDSLMATDFNEVSNLLDNGTNFTYEEMVEKFYGVEGTLNGLTSSSKSYIWVSKYEYTFSATFSDTKDGKVSIYRIG